MNVIEDSFQLASEVLRKHPPTYRKIQCNIAMEEGPFITADDFTYNFPETPHYFSERGILTIVDSRPISRRVSKTSNQDLKDIYEQAGINSLIEYENSSQKGLMTVEFDLEKLQEWFDHELFKKFQKEEKIVKFPPGKDYLYENGELYIKRQDGSAPCTLDLSKAHEYRPVFESFYYLFRDTNTKFFTREEILKSYNSLSKTDIEWRVLIKRKSSIVGKMINPKPCLKNRIVWEYDQKMHKYKFEILPLSDK